MKICGHCNIPNWNRLSIDFDVAKELCSCWIKKEKVKWWQTGCRDFENVDNVDERDLDEGDNDD